MRALFDAVAGRKALNSAEPEKRFQVVVEPSDRWRWTNVRELWHYRDLFFILAGRDLKVRYKQTVLGVAWVVIQPLLTAFILAVVFGFFVRIPSGGIPYVLLVMTGLLPWTYFSTAVQRASSSLLIDARLISKVYFPRLLIPFASIVASLVDLCVTTVVLLILLQVYRIPLSWRVVSLPIIVLVMTLAAGGIGVWLSAVSVKYRDMRNMLPFIMQIWLYATPVLYPLDVVPMEWRMLYSLNPSLVFVEGFRWALLGTNTLTFSTVAVSCATSVLLFVIGVQVFRKMQLLFDDTI